MNNNNTSSKLVTCEETNLSWNKIRQTQHVRVPMKTYSANNDIETANLRLVNPNATSVLTSRSYMGHVLAVDIVSVGDVLEIPCSSKGLLRA
jgi:hypothetical protein